MMILKIQNTKQVAGRASRVRSGPAWACTGVLATAFAFSGCSGNSASDPPETTGQVDARRKTVAPASTAAAPSTASAVPVPSATVTAVPLAAVAPNTSRLDVQIHRLPGAEAPRRRVPDRILVKMLASAVGSTPTADHLNALHSRLRSHVAGSLAVHPLRSAVANGTHRGAAPGPHVLRLELDGATGADAALDRARKDPDVEWAEADALLDAAAVVPNDPSYSLQWQHAAMNTPSAWATAKGDKSVIVAVLDTGIDYRHPDLQANIWTNPREIPGDGIDNDQNGYVDDIHGWDFVSVDPSLVDPSEDAAPPDNDPMDVVGHGTHVAGIIGATGNNGIGVAGVAWNVSLMPLRAGYLAAGGAGSFALSDIVEGLYYAADNGARVVNMSFGGGASLAMHDALDYAAGKGVLLVAAAGNNATSDRFYPAAEPSVLAVGALSDPTSRAYFSNYGTWVDVVAPGDSIFSTLPGGNYGYASGTSMAAPMVSGLAALLVSAHPDWTQQALYFQVLATAHSVDTTNPFERGRLGSGRVDAAAGVGAKATQPNANLVDVSFEERNGDGDGVLEPGEGVRVRVTLRGLSAGAAMTVKLASTDSLVSIPAPSVSAGVVPFDRTATVEFGLTLSKKTPTDHTVPLTLTLASGSFSYTAPASFVAAPTFHEAGHLPPYLELQSVPLPTGRTLVVADNVRGDILHQVYATTFGADGRGEALTVLSDPTGHAESPTVYLDGSGRAHVTFRQFDASHANPQLMYRRYDSATRTWSAEEKVTTDAAIFWYAAGDANRESLNQDAHGDLHVVWVDHRTGVAQLYDAIRTASGWRSSPIVALPDSNYAVWTSLVRAGSGSLVLYYRQSAVAEPFARRTYDGAAWGSSTSTTPVSTFSWTSRPFLFGSNVYEWGSPSAFSQPISLTRLSGTTWIVDRLALEPLDVLYGDNLALSMTQLGQVDAMASFDIDETGGSDRRFLQAVSGTTTSSKPLVGSPYYAAKFPVVSRDAAGVHHSFHGEYTVSLNVGTRILLNHHTEYFSDTSNWVPWLPTQPVVQDDGATTKDGSQLHAKWSSTHPTGILHYEVAVGTAPGLDDVAPWLLTDLTEGIWDFSATPLEPGRSYYVSARAISRALHGSLVGVSDGIYMDTVPRCMAAPWLSGIVYEDTGALVTYAGATYENLYWNSGATPGGSGAWKLVGACTGEPVLPLCTAADYDPARTYVGGEKVTSSEMEFLAQWYTKGLAPTGGPGNPFKYLSSCAPVP